MLCTIKHVHKARQDGNNPVSDETGFIFLLPLFNCPKEENE